VIYNDVQWAKLDALQAESPHDTFMIYYDPTDVDMTVRQEYTVLGHSQSIHLTITHDGITVFE
jgi:hypothetical protein